MVGFATKIMTCVIVCAFGVIAGGCVSQNQSSRVTAQSKPAAAPAHAAQSKQPFAYTPLKVRNSCFVESVHFYDEYLAGKLGGDYGWVRVLQWGNDDGTIHGVGAGHAVAVCRAGSVLWMYDINYGFVPLLAPVERRNDVTDVGPEIFGKYPQFKPVFVSYREDLLPSRPGTVPQYFSANGNADVRDATKVASALGVRRVARVISYVYPDSRTGRLRTGAAALFAFGQRLCIYFPSKGTHISRLYAGSLDDLLSAARIIRNVFPGASDVAWQTGRTWKQPRIDFASTEGRPLTAEPQPLRYFQIRTTLW